MLIALIPLKRIAAETVKKWLACPTSRLPRTGPRKATPPQGTSRTPQQWMKNEDLQPFNEANDRYMRLMAMVRATGKPLEARMATTAVLCLFQIDKFRELINAMNMFSHVVIDAARKTAIMEDSLDGDVAALNFALDWLELIIFGQSQGLAKK